MASKKYKFLAAEIDGVEQDSPIEVNTFSSDMMLGVAGFALAPETQATANSTKTLTLTSNSSQIFTGTTAGQVLKLPAANTLTAGKLYKVWNFSNKTISIVDAGSNVLATLNANAQTDIFLRDNSTSNGVWALTYTLDSGNVFGTSILFAEDAAETSNTSGTTWANKLTITTPSNLALGDYLLNFQFIWRSSSANREADFRFQLDGSNIVAWQPSTSRIQDRQLLSGFRRLQTISGSHSVTFDFKYANSSTTIYVVDARMFLWRIA